MPAPALDVLIKGAGPVGCTAALAMRQAGLSVALYDPQLAPPTFRPLALSYASRLIFERLGIWAALAVTPIERIVASQVGSFGRTRLDAADAGVPALGYQTDYAALLGALRSPLGDTLVSEPPEARCIVHAEGAPAEIAGKRYDHEVLVALLSSEPAAASTAYERFTDEGPLALAPLVGASATLMRFAASRRVDATAAIRVTDFLASGFSGARFRAARGAALMALDLFPAPRKFFARRMIFGARALP